MSKSAPEPRRGRLRGLLDEPPPHASTARASLGGALGDSLRLPTALASAFPPPPALSALPSLCRATASSAQPTAKPTTLTILPTRTDLLPRRSAHRGTTPTHARSRRPVLTPFDLLLRSYPRPRRSP